MSIKRIGTKNGCELFEARIRRGHEANDLAEIITMQGKTSTKKRFIIKLDDSFSLQEIHSLIQDMFFLNYHRNNIFQKENPTIYTNIELHKA